MTDVADQKIRLSLAKICESEEFAGSTRLQGLLVYVVEEALAGRGDGIRAKTIGLDVYDYSADEIALREGVVRVDAGRVRRKLEEYYEHTGKTDPVLISLPVGTYRPSFTAAESEPATPENARLLRIGAVLGGASVIAAVAAGLTFGLPFAPLKPTPPPLSMRTDRIDIFDVSPARLEAADLAAEGRDLIFPAVDIQRLMLALQVFEGAIEKDGMYFGGYAGAAQVLATLALMSPDENAGSTTLEQAARHERQALSLQPDAAWALSAAAWVKFVRKDIPAAVDLSHRAFEADPSDPHIVEFDSLISLYTSDYQRIFDQSRKRNESNVRGQNFVFEVALGSALFHTEDYRGAIAQFESAIQAGAPFGPILVTYLIASYQMVGEEYQASKLEKLLAQTWPEARVVSLKRRLFTQSLPADQLAEALGYTEQRD